MTQSLSLQLSSVEPSIPGQNSFTQENKATVNRLIAQYGKQLILNVWNQIPEQLRNQLQQGKISFDPYIESVEKKCVQSLVQQVMSMNQRTISTLHLSEAVAACCLSDYSIAELRAMALTEEAIQPRLEEIRHRGNQFSQIARQNNQLLKQLKRAFSQEIVEQAVSRLSPTRRGQIEQGIVALEDYLGSFRAACESIENRPSPPFLTREELAVFFHDAKLVGSKEAYNGVAFFEGIHNGNPLRLVVKCPEKIAQETFGSLLVDALKCRTPAFAIIDSSEPALFESVSKAAHLKENRSSQLLIMEYLPGSNLEELTLAELRPTLDAKPELFYDVVLVGLGEIAAVDLLLYYQDRFPILGMGNLANAMIVKSKEEFYSEAAAIDQVAYLSSKQTEMQRLLQVDPFKRIAGIVGEIAENPERISQEAIDLFELGFSEEIQYALDRPRALASLQKGLVNGLAKTGTMSEEKLAELHAKTPISLNPVDQVDLPAYQKMARTILSTVLLQASQSHAP